jgi:hypothetical protein
LGLGKLEEIVANAEGESPATMDWNTMKNSPQTLAEKAESGQQVIDNF